MSYIHSIVSMSMFVSACALISAAPANAQHLCGPEVTHHNVPVGDVEGYRRMAEARRARSECLGGTTLTIINRSSRSISSFYLYGFDTNWRTRLRQRIRPGGRGRIDIPASGLPCTNHLMTVFSDGEAFNAGNTPLCPATTIIVGEPNEPNGD
jgi:hypothetical protein